MCNDVFRSYSGGFFCSRLGFIFCLCLDCLCSSLCQTGSFLSEYGSSFTKESFKVDEESVIIFSPQFKLLNHSLGLLNLSLCISESYWR